MNPGERSMYHESWRTEYVSWILENGVCIMKEIFGHHKYFCVFFKKNLENGVCIMKRKSSKTQENCFAHHSPGFPVSTFFWKKWQKRNKNQSCVEHESPLEHESPGARIPLEHESPWRANPPRARISFAPEWSIFFYHHFFEPAHLPWVWMDVKTIESPQLICIIPIDCRQHLFWTNDKIADLENE